MSLKLYSHPLASFCWKALIALYENGAPFEPVLVDLGDETSRGEFLRLWPMGRMPVLRDEARDRTLPESSIIIEYLDRTYPGPAPLLPADVDLALQARLWDRVFDHYVQEPMQKIVGDQLRPAQAKDALGVERARAQLATAYDLVEKQMAGRTWAVDEVFTLADCAAAPGLYYANRVAPLGAGRPHTAAYLDRLTARPSFARVLREAEPYFPMFPQDG